LRTLIVLILFPRRRKGDRQFVKRLLENRQFVDIERIELPPTRSNGLSYA
jgi:hypothetical protein